MDTRFSFCAIAALRLLNRLDAVDVAKATDFVLSCKNFDGGFGVRPGSETHAGQIYCCLGFLAITGNLHMIDPDQLGEFGLWSPVMTSRPNSYSVASSVEYGGAFMAEADFG